MQIQDINSIILQHFSQKLRLKQINEGFSAEIFELPLGNQQFALKLFKPNIHIEERINEITVCQQINGNFIVKYVCHDSLQYKWILFDLFGDVNLEELLMFRNLERQEIYYIFLQIISGYRRIMECGYFHGDLKPQNIIVNSQTLQIQICDFGFSQKQQEKGSLLKGSKGYFSPEFFEDDNFSINELSEIFSLGIILFKLCYGEQPFINQYNCKKWLAIKNKNWREFWNKSRDPFKLNKIIEMCLQYEISKRCNLQQLEQTLYEQCDPQKITVHY